MTQINMSLRNINASPPTISVDHYIASITGYPPITIPTGQSQFNFPTLPPGQYNVFIRSYDANNNLLDTQQFNFNIPTPYGLIAVPGSIQVIP